MAKNDAPETVRLTHGEGDKAVTVSVSAEKAERMLAEGNGYTKATTRRRAAAKSDQS